MSVQKEVLYGNAKAILAKPAKRVWFRLNPLLEKTSLFASRRQDNSQFTLPLQSVVICEKFLEDKPAFQSTCTEADFWEYLWSENWRGWGSVRVFEGSLMDSLLETLHSLEESKEVVTHHTGVFTDNIRYNKRPFKGSTDLIKIKETLKISFTYYGRRTPSGELLFSSTACSSDTMSVPSFDDVPLSDEDYSESHSDLEDGEPGKYHDGKPDTLALNHEKDETEHKPDTTDEPEKKKKDKEATNESGIRDSKTPQEKIKSSSPYTSYLDWLRSRRDSSRGSASTSSGERSPYQPTMYSLPHFRCSRPTRSHADEISMSTRLDQESLAEEPPEIDTSMWLIETLRKASESGERTVDRLRKRLTEIREERNKKNLKPKTMVGFHFKEVVRLMESYGKQMMAVPNMHRCEKVPTFRQYIVQIVEDRTFDPRFRNKRRVQKFSKRYNLQSSSDYSILGSKHEQVKDKDKDKDSPKKSNRNKKPKGEIGIFKPRKSPSRMNIFSEPPTKTPVKTVEGKADEAATTSDEVPKTAQFVDIVIGITDCVAFRNPLAEVREGEGASPTYDPLASPGQSGIRQMRPSTCTFVETPTGGWQNPKTTSTGGHKTSASTTTHESESIEGGLAGIFKTRAKRLPGEALLPTRDPMPPSKPHSKKKRRKPHIMLDIDDENMEYSPSGNFSQGSGYTGTPDAFNARKLNRKYSFEKLKESKHTFGKPKFKEILKKFLKIQKVAGIFRKGAMFKPRKLRKQFHNPLQMSPSPDPSMHFIGKATGRRQALVADIDVQAFKHPSPAEFREQLMKALDEFVVRKEHVISTYKTRCLACITFTRPEIFARKHE